MKGIVFNVLEAIVRRDLGEAAWDALLTEAGLEGAYTSLGSYPDEELCRLVAAGARLGTTPAEAVRWFGCEAIPHFRMCTFAEGLIEGAAVHYAENVDVRLAARMHQDGPACTFEHRSQPAERAAA